MKKGLLFVLAAFFVVFAGRVFAEEGVAKKARPVKAPSVVETRLSEHDLGRIEHSISKAVVAKQGTGSWEYTARKMKPPKNDKWQKEWNEMGSEGWEAIDHFENVYIFKRPALLGSMKPSTSIEPPPAEMTSKEMKQDDKAKEKAMKDADRAAEKAKREEEKAAKKAQKEAEKAAKKAQKEQEAAAKKAAKEATQKSE